MKLNGPYSWKRILMFVPAVGWLLPCAFAAAQTMGVWELQAPRPTAATLHGVHMVSATEAWVVGDNGFILHTTDGGADWHNWQEQESGTLTQPLQDVSFAGNQHGVIVGNFILYTFDGGKNWEQSASGPFGSLYGVDLVDDNLGWACGFGIVKTTNGGITWTSQPAPASNLAAIDFVDAQRGWAVGANGTIIATVNGGQTWTPQNSGTNAFLGSVSFVNANEGWAVGGNVFLHTTNGGQTWTPQSVPSNTWAFDVDFFDATHGGAAGSTMNIVRTDNGGGTWITELGGVNSDPTYTTQTFNAISFGDALHAMAVGTGGVIHWTQDGGDTWIARQNGARFIGAPNVNGLTGSPWHGGIFALDINTAWAAGDVCSTTDGGETWTRLGVPANDVVFADPLNGWKCEYGGIQPIIRKTTDGGATWIGVTDPDVNLGVWASIDTADGQTIIAVGWDGSYARIIRSIDGGNQWTLLPPDLNSNLYNEIDMVTPLVGYISGSNGRILKTVNGGASWTIQNSGAAGSQLRSISFSDVDRGWAVGANSGGGVIRRTVNGGQTWMAMPLPPGSGGFWDVDAVSTDVAWLSGIGYLARTINDGQTWQTENVGYTPFEFYDVEFVDADNGWAVSSGATSRGSDRGGVFRRRPKSKPPIVGDVNGDNVVDIDDLFAVIAAWGPCPAPPDDCPTDLDNDGDTDIDDLFTVIANWT